MKPAASAQVAEIARVPSNWPHRNRSRSVRVGRLDWHVQIGGEGPAVLLLHGTGASAHSWSDVINVLGPQVCVIAPDLPGHGFTRGAMVRDLTLPIIAAQLDELLEVLKIGRIDLVAGHSAGAPLAMRWAMGRANETVPIVGFNPALIAPPAGYTNFIAPLLVPIATSSLVASLVSHIGVPSGMVQHLLRSTGSEVPAEQRLRYDQLFRMPSHVSGAMGLMAAADLPSLLKAANTMTAPVTLVVGMQDDWIPIKRLMPVVDEYLPRATVLRWPGGHLLHESVPEKAAALLMSQLTPSVDIKGTAS